MRKLVYGAAALALAGCGGGGSSSSTSPFYGLYTGTTDIFVAGNATATPDTDNAATAGVVNRNGTFSFNVTRVTTVGASPDAITGRLQADGTVSSASLRYIDGDGVTGATHTVTGTGTMVGGALAPTITLTFPTSVGQANPLRYVLTLAPTP